MVSLDGFYEGPGHDIDWHVADAEFNAYAMDLLHSVDTLIFGRITYQLMAGYWPTHQASSNDQQVAGKMNSLSKLVFSKTLSLVDWENTRLLHGNVAEEISKIKQQPGKDLALLGSSDLALTFIEHSLIDEYRIFVNPIVLGDGKRLFEGLEDRLNLKLIKTRTFDSGNVLFCYEPDKK